MFVEASTSGLCQTRLTEVSKSPTDMTGRLTAVEWVVQDRGLMNSVEDSSCVDLFIIVLSFTKQWSGTSFANPQTSEHVVWSAFNVRWRKECVWVCVCFNVLQHISRSSGGSEAALPPWICSNWTSVRLSDLGLTEVHWTVCVSLWLYDHARVRLCVNMGGCTGVCSGGCRPSVCMWMWMC